MAARPMRAKVGTMTPARAGCMCRSSSCRFMKYQGALEGLGGRFRVARFSSGAAAGAQKGDGHEDGRQQRQADNVQSVEPDEGVGSHLEAADEDELGLLPQH